MTTPDRPQVHPLTTLELRALASSALQRLGELDESLERLSMREQNEREESKGVAFYALRFVFAELARRGAVEALPRLATILATVEEHFGYREDNPDLAVEALDPVVTQLSAQQLRALLAHPRPLVRERLARVLPTDTSRGRAALEALSRDRSRRVRKQASARLGGNLVWWEGLLPRDPSALPQPERIRAALDGDVLTQDALVELAAGLPDDVAAALLATLLKERAVGYPATRVLGALLQTPGSASLAAEVFLQDGAIPYEPKLKELLEELTDEGRAALCTAVARRVLDESAAGRASFSSVGPTVGSLLSSWPRSLDPRPVLEILVGSPLEGASTAGKRERTAVDYFAYEICNGIAVNEALQSESSAARALMREAFTAGRPGTWEHLPDYAFKAVFSSAELGAITLSELHGEDEPRLERALVRSCRALASHLGPADSQRIDERCRELYPQHRALVLRERPNPVVDLARAELQRGELDAVSAAYLMEALAPLIPSFIRSRQKGQEPDEPSNPPPTEAEWTAFRQAYERTSDAVRAEHSVLLASPRPPGPLQPIDQPRVLAALLRARDITTKDPDARALGLLVDSLVADGTDLALDCLLQYIARNHPIGPRPFDHAALDTPLPETLRRALATQDSQNLGRWLRGE